MFQDTQSSPATATVLSGILERVGMPFFLFSGALLFLLLFSWGFLLPRLTGIEVEGAALSPAEARVYAQHLRGQVEQMEQKRNSLVLPLQNPLYDALKGRKNMMDSFLRVYRETEKDFLVLDAVHYDAVSGGVRLRGDVRNVGPRSMTVLAQLLDRLRSLSGVSSLESPAFVREQDAEIGFYSPFSFLLHL